MINLHAHTGISSASCGFSDSTIEIESLFKYAVDNNLDYVSITEHEILGDHIIAEELAKKYEVNLILGNEIYLMDNYQYENAKKNNTENVYFPHFILLATDEIGHKYLRELSTRAWVNNGFTKNNLYRRPTLFDDLYEVIKEKGHLIASTACLGNQLNKSFTDTGIANPKDFNKEFLNDLISKDVDNEIFSEDFTELTNDCSQTNEKNCHIR